MNANHIVKDSFSNPDTERLFTGWAVGRAEAMIASNQNCGACRCAWFLVDAPGEYEWLVCLQEDSSYYLETLSWAFGCAKQIPDPTVQQFMLPSFDPPQFPSSYPAPGLGDE